MQLYVGDSSQAMLGGGECGVTEKRGEEDKVECDDWKRRNMRCFTGHPDNPPTEARRSGKADVYDEASALN